MKKITLLFLFVLISVSLFAGKVGTLQGIFKPQMIKAFGDELFIVEKHSYYIFSAKDLSLKKKVGRLGEGPGEFKPDPSRPILISINRDFIIGESRNKVIHFNRAGKFVKEFRKSPGIIQTLPVGKNLAVLRILYGPGGQNYFAVSIYNQDMKEIKMLYKQKFFTYENKVFVLPDGLHYSVIGEKVYVEQSPDGFVIGVYDSLGNKIKEIKKDYLKKPVTKKDKEDAFNSLLDIPSMQRVIKERGRAAAIAMTNKQDVTYPDHFPAIKYMVADKNRLYIRTHHRKESKDQYLEMDTDGKILNTFYLPTVRDVDFLVKLQGDKKYYTIHNGTFYYLKLVDQDDEEAWEVHVEYLK
jgi:hypothetical protein